MELDRLAPSLLGNCLANEIQISPDLLENAIEWYAKNKYGTDDDIIEIIINNKFGNAFRKKVRECFFEKYDDRYIFEIGSVLSDIFLSD